MNMGRLALRALPMAMLLIAAAGPFASGRSKSSDAASSAPAAPEIKLSVTPHHGFRPLTVTLTAHLGGVASDDEQFCHVGVEWESRTPDGLTVTSKEDPKCLHPPEQIRVQTVFTKVTTITRPGAYIYRLILHRRDGETVISNTQEVRVLDNL